MNSTDKNYSDSAFSSLLEYDATFLSVMTLFYIPLIVTTILSNSALIWAILYNAFLHNPTNVFIFNIGLIDIFYSAMHLPIQLSMFWTGRETFSCSIHSYLSVVFGFLSGYFCVVVALNRCVTICCKASISGRIFTVKLSILYCAILWILALVQNFPQNFLVKSKSVFNAFQRTCDTPSEDRTKIYLPLLSLLGTAVLVVLLYGILYAYVKRFNSKISETLGGQNHLKEALKIAKLTFLMFAVYVVLLIPSFTLKAADPKRSSNPALFNLAYFVAFLDPLVNMVIYVGLHRQIRTVIKERFFTLNPASNRVTAISGAIRPSNLSTDLEDRQRYYGSRRLATIETIDI